MLSSRCKIEDYKIADLTFTDLVKFVELSKSNITTSRIIQFKTSTEALIGHHGLVQLRQSFGPQNNGCSSYRYTVLSNILTFLGPTGILPAHYTERALALVKEGDKTMIDFLDIFYNKLMYSLYRIFKGTDVILNFQLYALGKEKRLPYVVRQVSSFIGIDCEPGKDIGILLRYGGAVSMHSRSLAVLQSIVSSFIGEPVLIKQFVLIKDALPQEERVRLGINSTFRKAFYCGSNVYFYQNKISIKIVDLGLFKYRSLIYQKRDQTSQLNKLIRNYLGSSILYDLELRLRPKDKATILLANSPPSLGIDLWCSVRKNNAKT